MEMVAFARAGTKELRDFTKLKMETLKVEGLKLKNQVPAHRELTDNEKATFYSSWIFSAVRLLCSIRPRQVEEILEQFRLERE